MKKRIVALALAGLMALGAVGCGDAQADAEAMQERIEELERENRRLQEQLGSGAAAQTGAAGELPGQTQAPDESRMPADFTAEASGFCGADLAWEYGSGILHIHGTGEMTDYRREDARAPWLEDFGGKITRVFIDEGCTSIGSYAFYGTYAYHNYSVLSGVKIADSVTRIGAYAFSECRELRGITLPDSLTEIEEHAFYSCEKLESITIPSFVTEIGTGAFEHCGRLESVILPDSVTKMGGSAFNSCRNLAYFQFPSGMREIDFYCISSCSETIHIVLPDALESVEAVKYIAKSDYPKQEITSEQWRQMEEQLKQEWTAAIEADPDSFWYADLMDSCTIGKYSIITWRGRDYTASEVQDFLNDLISAGALQADVWPSDVERYVDDYMNRHYD